MGGQIYNPNDKNQGIHLEEFAHLIRYLQILLGHKHE